MIVISIKVASHFLSQRVFCMVIDNCLFHGSLKQTRSECWIRPELEEYRVKYGFKLNVILIPFATEV